MYIVLSIIWNPNFSIVFCLIRDMSCTNNYLLKRILDIACGHVPIILLCLSLITSCSARWLPQYASAHLDFWPFDPEVGVGVACDLGYPCAEFHLPRPFGYRVRADVRDIRRTDGRRTPMTALCPLPPTTGRGNNNKQLQQDLNKFNERWTHGFLI